MKRYLLLIILSFSCIPFLNAGTFVKGGGGRTSFAIIVDDMTYRMCREQIDEYRSVLQSEGLNTCIIADEWNSPEQVKSVIEKYAFRKPVLEGVVLVGDIPIVRVRRGQHLTTAFKMNERTFPMEESSVPSDRFYDDFDLKFSFIKRDSLNPLIYYYNLSEEGAQHIDSDIYSARIKVPESMYSSEDQKYEILSNYFRKVVDAHKVFNPVDNFIYFAGHGYNSDCLTAWRQQYFMFKEYFPDCYYSADNHEFMNFRQYPDMKYQLFSQLQKDNTDIFMFYEHGAFNIQYINGERRTSSLQSSLDELMYEIREEFRKSVNNEKRRNDLLAYLKETGIDAGLFTDELLEKYRKADSVKSRSINIYQEELAELNLGSRFVMLNACYNGSFHREDGYVAAYHIFNPGKTIVAQGNTVNVLQDKWADELIGMLALGFRVGQWQREVNTLESHMTGDPTYRFVSEDGVDNSVCMSNALVLEKDNIDYWSGLMDSKSCTGRALAVKRISELRKDYSHELLRMFRKEGSIAVKLQILDAMMNYGNSDRDSLLLLALKDNSELVRRLSTYHACRVGKDIFIEPVLNNYLFHNEAQRVIYASETNLKLFDMEKVQETGNRLLEASNLMDVNYAVDVFNKSVAAQKKRLKADIDVIFDKSASYDRRESAIRGLRNYPMSQYASVLASFVADPSQDENLRVVMCEALGWFNMSFAKDEIIGILEPLSVDATISGRLREEALKSCKRLKTTSDI